jgi:2-polyprenyl-3-methyl-5-hydroxy-6-metoxy-1,4-benzoquinol methylase
LETDPLFSYTQKNRRAWNEIAQVRSRTFPPADFFAGGGSTLGQREVDAVTGAFGSLNGLRLIHLQCATGEETLSWSVLGAAALGVDISDEQVEIANRKAAEAGLNTRFTAAARAGLTIEILEEIPGGAEWRFGEQQGDFFHLPGRYLLVAKK